ncbi:lasso peptide isopeptide bond-forming cyclase [Oceanobacillus saliphilus]|uniref:lasso peptide isopeptide bond-forming cyclase n=1 Tax=Oceanobacillus saliphilus TaxID=2925834 RepID=UPI00201E02C8|nr:lasso peptide isopeptide bond-forming cyclase [Oceanobacillus saliphilus]
MSAIAGIYHFNKEPIPSNHSFLIMKALQKFPDDDAMIWQQENVFLGCHAQWITPESVGEPLPFYDNERQMAITADAIIDNREELFDILQVDREKRKIIPDSQLILLAYSKWGEDVPKHLIGDFAFMIWDEKNQKLFGARDFSGARTLYYYNQNHRFAFCTIMEPLLSLPFIEKRINEQWLADYLAIPNMIDTIDTSITVIKSIKELSPSSTISVVEGKVIVSKYNILELGNKVKFKTEKDYIEAFRDVFQQAVDARLRTFHPVGSHLSGGLDSGSVVSFAAKSLLNQNKKLHTYSYIPEADFTDWTPYHRMADERPFIKSTVQYVGNINEHYLSFDGKSPISEIDEWLEIMEMPYKFFENSVWIKGIYEHASQKGIGIMLNGARGNLGISWGRALDYYAILLKKRKWIQLYFEVNKYSKNIGVFDKFRIFSVIKDKAYPTNKRRTNESYELPMLINPDFAMRTNVFDRLQKKGIDYKGFSKQNIYDFRKNHFQDDFSWNTTNTCNAKLSLRYGLLDRDPTNDIRVIRYCLSVPEEQYVKNGVDRALIRKATEGYLPNNVRLNQKIRGIQGADWIHRMAPDWNLFLEELQRLIKDSTISEFINVKVIKTAISKVKEGPREECAFDPDFRILMRSLIVFRYLQTFHS